MSQPTNNQEWEEELRNLIEMHINGIDTRKELSDDVFPFLRQEIRKAKKEGKKLGYEQCKKDYGTKQN